MPALEGDHAERLSQDDQATRTEAQFLAESLQRQQLAALLPGARPGRCANCTQSCSPRAVYCDAGCRDDHERRLGARARNGAAA